MNILVCISMKDAAKCDNQCESQNSVSHLISERKLCCYIFIVTCLFQNLNEAMKRIYLLLFFLISFLYIINNINVFFFFFCYYKFLL